MLDIEKWATTSPSAAPVTIADYRACQEAQKRAWGISDDGYLIPVATMVGANLHGGLVLRRVSAAVVKPSRCRSRSSAESKAVCASTRNSPAWCPSINRAVWAIEIKLFQSQVALAEGIERIAWSFDPLQAGNAHFNLDSPGCPRPPIHRKHVRPAHRPAQCRRTHRPAHRRVEPRGRPPCPALLRIGSGLPRLIELKETPRQCLVPVGVSAELHRRRATALLEIPIDIVALRSEDPVLAETWRSLVAQAFQQAFSKSYRAVHFVVIIPRLSAGAFTSSSDYNGASFGCWCSSFQKRP